MDAADTAEFERLVRDDGPALLRAACLLTGDRGHGEDLFQSALERTVRHWHRIEGPPGAYARTVLVNLATDRWRRRRVRPGEQPLTEGFDLAGPGDPAADAVLRTSVARALRELPPRQRAVMVLRYHLDLSEAEIATTLGVGVGTVKNTAAKARERLRSSLAHLQAEEGAR
jgi:RNA polymerase sigma-70 factor (sigma-E family)